MTFKQELQADLNEVFLNLEEFAEERLFRGQPLACVVDENHSPASTGAAGGFRNSSGLGVLHCDRLVWCKAADVQPVPAPGERVEMDGWLWLVGDDVSICAGLLNLPLNRAY